MSESETLVHHLDARRLLCPLPVIKTQNAVKQLASGTIVQVTATDPGVLHDIPAWCRVHGHEVLLAEKNDEEVLVRLLVNKKG
ncbi:MAG: sulfurtransferase TusA family protein [Moraxellaceae bacterium]|nr:sulfurtransferase TusA family protein [Moraxellaceae bacterium]